MPWFKVDDGLAFHRKVLKAGNEALGAWVRAGAWSSAPANLTDGWIPPEVCSQIAPPRVWSKLRAAGLTEEPSDGRDGEQLHDFLVYNPSGAEHRAERDALSDARREAGRRGGKRSGEARRAKQDGSNAEANSKQTRSKPPSDDQAKQSPDPDPDPREEERDVGEDPGDVPGPRGGSGVSSGDRPEEPEDGDGEGEPVPDAGQVALPLDGAAPAQGRKAARRDVPAEVHGVYLDGWKRVVGKGAPPRLTPARRKLLAARVAEGFDPEQLLAAARGAWLPSWHLEHQQNSLDQVFAKADRVEKFAALAERGQPGIAAAAPSRNPHEPPPIRLDAYELPVPPPKPPEPRREYRPVIIPGLSRPLAANGSAS